MSRHRLVPKLSQLVIGRCINQANFNLVLRWLSNPSILVIV